jgi:FKBP12-rapamycin complex-associated protein
VDKAKMVVNIIRDDLNPKNKTFCVETIQCLRVIFTIHSKRFSEFTDVDVLVNYILLNGLQSESISFLNELQKSLPNISEYVQFKLLSTIAAVLLKKIINFVVPNHSNKELDLKVLESF